MLRSACPRCQSPVGLVGLGTTPSYPVPPGVQPGTWPTSGHRHSSSSRPRQLPPVQPDDAQRRCGGLKPGIWPPTENWTPPRWVELPPPGLPVHLLSVLVCHAGRPWPAPSSRARPHSTGGPGHHAQTGIRVSPPSSFSSFSVKAASRRFRIWLAICSIGLWVQSIGGRRLSQTGPGHFGRRKITSRDVLNSWGGGPHRPNFLQEKKGF